MLNKKSISHSFSVSTIEDGEQGKRGRFPYYEGDWDGFSLDKEFRVTDSQMPFFKVVSNGQTRYYVYNPTKNGIYMKSDMGTPSNNAPWETMTNDFKYLITEAIFSNFAHFGGAIISGDWMISTNGTINGTSYDNGTPYNNYPAYMWFDPAYPNQSVYTTHNVNGTTWTGYNFVPNYCVDLLTGATYQQNAYVAGAIYTKSIQTKFMSIDKWGEYLSSDGNQFVVGMTEYWGDGNGRISVEKGVWNFMFPNGEVEVVLPTNQYEHFGQRVILYNPTFPTYPKEIRVYAADVSYDDQEGKWKTIYNDKYPIRGIGVAQRQGQPSQWGTYETIKQIGLVDGILEFMCVPPQSGNNGHKCDWCLVNAACTWYSLWYNDYNHKNIYLYL